MTRYHVWTTAEIRRASTARASGLDWAEVGALFNVTAGSARKAVSRSPLAAGSHGQKGDSRPKEATPAASTPSGVPHA